MEFKYTNINQFNSYIPPITQTLNTQIINISKEESNPKEILKKFLITQ